MDFTKIITDGLRGFAIFFSISLVVELFRFSVGISNSFSIDIIDFYNSLLEIVLFILVSITKDLISIE